MDGVELQSLAAMDRHQSNSINVQSGGGNLTHVTLLGKKD
jgi:hypothetical protein